jgi:hypothetical protein
VVDTVWHAVRTVQEASPATKKGSGNVIYESRKAKKVSNLLSTSSTSEHRGDLAFLFAITHRTRSAPPDWDRDSTHVEEYNASTAKNAQLKKILGGPADVAAEDGGIGVDGCSGAYSREGCHPRSFGGGS